MILFALASVVMIGMMGLATDLGYAYEQRRAMQNSADAAAEAGARIVAKAATNTTLSAQSDAQAMASANAGTVAPTVSCNYVDDSDKVISACSNAVPSNATGVKVTATETHRTFFMQVVPGAANTVTTSATASAHVQLMSELTPDGPFIVCGVGTELAKGGSLSILNSSNGQWLLNTSAANQTFEIHGPQIADCGTQANRFKGLADQVANQKQSVPGWLTYDTGTKAGPTRTKVNGIQGCNVGDYSDCVMILPIAVNNPAEQGNSKQIYVVTYAAFYVTQSAANTHDGKLVLDYIPTGAGTSGWTRQTPGPIVIRVTK